MKLFSRLLLIVISILVAESVSAARFSCSDGDVTCLIASINSANQRSGNNKILLGPGVYRLTAIDNTMDGNIDLPVIVRDITIRATSTTEPTVIEDDTGSATGIGLRSRLFLVSAFGNLTLDGLVLQSVSVVEFDLIRNLGTLSIQNSIITGINVRNPDGTSPIDNFGNLTISHSVMDFNRGEHGGGGAITNETGGFASIEHSTIANNFNFPGAIVNRGSLSINKSSLVHNSSDLVQPGGAILNLGGTVDIVSSTFTRNAASIGGAVFNNLGTVSILNSTVAENTARFGRAVWNNGGLFRLQNTIVANNIDEGEASENKPDCGSDPTQSVPIVSLGNNVIGDITGCNINLQPSDHVGDPGLGQLVADDDESIPGQIYYPILAGSPAINASDKKACPKRDQLGNKRVGRCDIGAIEFQE